jgi:hypothetical protein
LKSTLVVLVVMLKNYFVKLKQLNTFTLTQVKFAQLNGKKAKQLLLLQST